MSFESTLQDASFRGIPFLTEDLSTTIGRRTVLHEYPFQDTPYSEDLGRKGRSYRINAYVMGDDHNTQRDALMEAIEQGGEGELIHPEYGLLNVVVQQDCDVKTVTKEHRITQFSLVFYESGEQAFPSVQTNVIAQQTAQLQAIRENLSVSLHLSFTGGAVDEVALTQSLSLIQNLFPDFVIPTDISNIVNIMQQLDELMESF